MSNQSSQCQTKDSLLKAKNRHGSIRVIDNLAASSMVRPKSTTTSPYRKAVRGNPGGQQHPTSSSHLHKPHFFDPSAQLLDSTSLVHLQVRGKNQLNKELIELDKGH